MPDQLNTSPSATPTQVQNLREELPLETLQVVETIGAEDKLLALVSGKGRLVTPTVIKDFALDKINFPIPITVDNAPLPSVSAPPSVYKKSSIDANFYSKTESDQKFALKSQAVGGGGTFIDAYTKTEINTNFYTKIVIDQNFALKSEIPAPVSLANFYTKTEIGTNFYDKTVSDQKFVLKSEIIAPNTIYTKTEIDASFANKTIAQDYAGIQNFTDGIRVAGYRIVVSGSRPPATTSAKFYWVDTVTRIAWLSQGTSYLGVQDRELFNGAFGQTNSNNRLYPASFWPISVGNYLESYNMIFDPYTAYVAGTAEWRAEILSTNLDGTTNPTIVVPLVPEAATAVIRADINIGYMSLKSIQTKFTKVGSPGSLTGSISLKVRPYLL